MEGTSRILETWHMATPMECQCYGGHMTPRAAPKERRVLWEARGGPSRGLHGDSEGVPVLWRAPIGSSRYGIRRLRWSAGAMAGTRSHGQLCGTPGAMEGIRRAITGSASAKEGTGRSLGRRPVALPMECSCYGRHKNWRKHAGAYVGAKIKVRDSSTERRPPASRT